MTKPVESITAVSQADSAVERQHVDHLIRAQLSNRRARLSDAIPHAKEPDRLAALLKEIDGALERLDAGTYGTCDECHKWIGPDTLRMDPLVRICLEHLTMQEQRAIERDLELASTIQAQLLPRNNMLHAGWELSFHYEPAGTVSGDYCDALPIVNPQQSAIFLVGDVSGKGVAASLLMSQLHAIFRTLVANLPGLQDLMSRANRMFSETTLSSHFATLVSVEALADGSVRVCNAGHCRPLIVRRSGVEYLDSTSLPLGLFFSAPFACTAHNLEPGDSMILYTDGLSEAQDEQEKQYGEQRLAEVASSARNLRTPELLDAIRKDLSAFRGSAPRQDDLTIMVVRRSHYAPESAPAEAFA